MRAWTSHAVVEDCPSELAACQVCQNHHCRNEEWLNCERRLAAKRYIEAGDLQGVDRLRQAHALDAAACAKVQPEQGVS